MENVKKIVFFKRLKMALFELENYIDFTAEKFGKSLWFMIRMILIFSLLVTVSNIAFIYMKYKTPTEYVNTILPDFTYEDKKLNISDDSKKDDNQKNMAMVMQQLEPTYREFIPDGTYTKNDILNYVTENERNVVIVVATTLFLENILDLFMFWLSVALLTSLIGLIVLRFSKIKMKYSKLFALSIYSCTLSIILTVVYSMLNSYFNIYIDIFEYLSMLIAYIYITAVIYMIKTDLIKQQLELIKITTVQAKVKEQMEREDREEKKKQDKEKKNKEEDEKERTEDGLDDEPDGSEI